MSFQDTMHVSYAHHPTIDKPISSSSGPYPGGSATELKIWQGVAHISQCSGQGSIGMFQVPASKRTFVLDLCIVSCDMVN